jgi:hypothetical protein
VAALVLANRGLLLLSGASLEWLPPLEARVAALVLTNLGPLLLLRSA